MLVILATSSGNLFIVFALSLELLTHATALPCQYSMSKDVEVSSKLA